MQVIAGAVNGTGYVVNACNEGFFYNGQSWIMIAGPWDPAATAGTSAAAAARGVAPEGHSTNSSAASSWRRSRRVQQEARPVFDLNQSPRDKPVGAAAGPCCWGRPADTQLSLARQRWLPLLAPRSWAHNASP